LDFPGGVVYLVDPRHGEVAIGWASDGEGQLVERDRHPPVRRLLDRKFVVASAEVLHEAAPGDDDPGAAAHRTLPLTAPSSTGIPASRSIRAAARFSEVAPLSRRLPELVHWTGA
jgi:hypothetical protein